MLRDKHIIFLLIIKILFSWLRIVDLLFAILFVFISLFFFCIVGNISYTF